MSRVIVFPKRRQAGFSLVELMVALLLGSIVVVAAVSLFTTNQRTFQLQQGVSDVQQQGRFVLDYMAQDLRRMGYRVADAYLTAPANINGVAVPGSENGTGFNQSDRLSFQYEGTVDCEGDVAAIEDLIGVTYWVNANAQLMCMGTVDPATNGLPLVENVDTFQVLVGVGAGDVSQGVTWTETYRRPNAVGTDFVTSIKASLLIAADTVVGAPQQARNFMVLDQLFQAGVAPLDANRIRRQFNMSVAVRNYDVTQVPAP